MGNSASKKEVKRLYKLDLNTVPKLCDYKVIARVVDCYDGDTCTIVFMIGGVPFKIRLRLAGIDTAEKPRRKDGSDRTAVERELSQAALDFLAERVLHKCTYVELHKWGKWGGRAIGNIWCVDKKGRKTGECLSNQLLACGLAVPYDGSKKDTDWNAVYAAWKSKC